MRIVVKIAAAATLTIILGTAPIAVSWAKLGPDELAAALKAEKVLSGEAKVSLQGSEAILSIYRSDTATDKDCKIDAAMAAKTLFNSDPELARVVVHFHYKQNPAAYSEVGVSVGDVKAYAAGTITKDQLLDGISLHQHIPSAAPHTIPSSGMAPPAAGMAVFNHPGYGVRFEYPSTWTPEGPQSSNILTRFKVKYQSEQPTVVELKVFPAEGITPVDVATMNPQKIFQPAWRAAWLDMMTKRMGVGALSKMPGENSRVSWYYVRLAGVTLPLSLVIGANRSIKAAQKAYYASAMLSPDTYMRTVAFGGGKYIYQLNMVADKMDSSTGSVDFERVLSSVYVAAASPSKPATKSKSHK